MTADKNSVKKIPRLALAACTVYVALPAIVGILGVVGLSSLGINNDASRGLLAAAAFGFFIGLPLVIFQGMALFGRNRTAALLVAWFFRCTVALFLLGWINLLLVGNDDGQPFRIFPEVTFGMTVMLLNFLTGECMARYSRQLARVNYKTAN